MRILVTGGAGFIGSNFVRRTLVTRPEVTVTVLDAFTYAAHQDNLCDTDGSDLCEVVRGDIRDAELVDSLAARVDVVVNFAAESHNDNSLADADPFVTTNVNGTVRLLEAARRHGVRFHQISTDEVFGDLDFTDPARFTPESPYRPSSPYSASKAAADHFVRAWVRSHGVAATISSCSNNYGPRQHPEKFIPRQICGLIDGRAPRVYGDGRNVRDWIHVDDHTDAIWAVLDRGAIGDTYLIGADGERANIVVAGDILQCFGRSRDDIVRVTDRPGHDRRYAIDPTSTRSLGWAPRHTDFTTGLAQTVQWYRDNEQWWRPAFAVTEASYAATESPLT